MAMTDKEYVEHTGQTCPFCLSGEVETVSSIEADGDTAWCTVHCNDCDSVWIDQFHLVGYSTVTDNVQSNHEQLLDEVIGDAVDTCVNDTDYLRSLLREHFSKMSPAEIQKLHCDAFDCSIDDE